MKEKKAVHLGFTRTEKKVIDGLVEAWNQFLKLPSIHPDETEDFRRAINSAQCLMGARVAQRVEPKMWRKP